jgi:3-hydroxyisobutyrate dehydrogenase
MGPANALEGSGLMLVSGEQSRYDTLLPALQTMTGHVLYLGDAPERAAAFKLFGNLTLIGIMGVLGDVNRLAHALGACRAWGASAAN